LASLPTLIFWLSKNEVDYLAVKDRSSDSAATKGARSHETEATYASFVAEKEMAKKLERNAQKRPNDARQTEVLLDACRYFLPDAYPLNTDFVLDLPDELRDLFNDWAQSSLGQQLSNTRSDVKKPAKAGFFVL